MKRVAADGGEIRRSHRRQDPPFFECLAFHLVEVLRMHLQLEARNWIFVFFLDDRGGHSDFDQVSGVDARCEV
ncbi:hypothetical protein R1flu_021111 [Riccia fluitans]|uniref:Uncharacterized protein n=1 Tax=Riccia fluitans TaxID=41844 RepID=A0ABD1ZNN0_9MARC